MSTRSEDAIESMFQRIQRTALTEAQLEARREAERVEFRRRVDECLLAARFPSRCVATNEITGEGWKRAERLLTQAVSQRVASTWLVIGTRGGGKTTMATSAARAVVIAGGRARFTYLPEVLDGMREAATTTLKRLGNVGLLVIDDVATEAKMTPWQRDALTALIRRRHDNELPTVLTANGTKSAVVMRLGPTIASRLAQGGIISADWPSFRHGKHIE